MNFIIISQVTHKTNFCLEISQIHFEIISYLSH